MLPNSSSSLKGYDDWTQQYARDDEIQAISDILESLHTTPRRIHIVGISCVESIELLRDYYASLGYEDQLAKNYILPPGTLLTVSISLRHLLWCEKDKTRLHTRDTQGRPYYAVVPPLRSPRDLRALQQAVRMGIIPCVDVGQDTTYLPHLLERQILTPFQMVRSVGYAWRYHGFL